MRSQLQQEGVARRRPLLVVAVVLLAACGGDKATAPAPVLTTLSVSLTPATVQAGQAASASAAGLDQHGSPIATGTVVWSSGTPSVATINASGVIVTLAAGQTQITASAGGKAGAATLTVTPAAVASVSIVPAAASVIVGGTQQLAALTVDAGGNTLSGRVVTWSTSDASKATVSASGLVTAVAPGSATITATCESRTATATITVVPVGDFAIVDAQFTQGVQTSGGTLPMVLSGDAAAVNVLMSGTAVTAPSMQVVLRLFDASGALVRTDTARTSGTPGRSPTYAAPTLQFLVPASVIATGLRWQVERDPKHLLPDDSSANDVFPRSGRAALATIAVPPLTVRFVPIVLASNAGTTANVPDASIPQYLQTLLRVHPLGLVSAHVGTAFTTNASFGSPPTGGAAAFWQQLISELDLARLADPVEPTANWFGVVLPPAGFTFTSYGGFSYIPSSGTNTGANTRTSAAVQVGWFNNPLQSRDLVAHEIGHTFGRQHAPCGGAGAPLDPNFPVAGGLIDFAGHDVYSWATGATSFAATIPTTTGDVMGYCNPVWSSTYTYGAVLNFRGTAAALAQAVPAQITRVLVVRGRIENAREIFLEPAFTLDARPSLPERAGPYTADGLDSLGRVLFSYAFEPAVLDHAATIRPFTLSIPSTPDLEQRLESIVVRGGGAAAQLARARALPSAQAVPGGAAAPAASVARAAGGALRARCADAAARGILAVDSRSGSVLGMASASSMQVISPSGSPLTIICSDGVRSMPTALRVP